MKLTAGISCVLAVTCLFSLLSCGGSSDTAPSRLSSFPADIVNPKAEVSGIFQDGWAEDTCAATLQQPSGDQAFTIRGMVPNLGDASFQTTVELRVDNQSVGTKTVGVGDFDFSAPVASGPGRRRVTALFKPVQQLPTGDGRMVGARLVFLGFEPPGRSGPPSDIVRGAGLELGTGWGVIETFRGETFRWVDNDAHIRITGAQAGDAALSMVVEPGPGLAGKRLLLKVLDETGRQVAAAAVARRGSVSLFVPIEAGKPNEFRLHVDGGGKPAKNDPRIMNFRVFRAEVAHGEAIPPSH